MPVYMIQAGPFGDVKIGLAKDPWARLKNLQTSQSARLRLIRVFEGGEAEEKALHARFAVHRKIGEWFAPVPEILKGDIGLPDLPVPKAKYRRDFDLATAVGREESYLSDLLEAIGGVAALTKACGIPPWRVIGEWNVQRVHLSAIVVLARIAGVKVTLKHLLDLRDASDAEKAEKNKTDKNRLMWDKEQEATWIAKNSAEDVWWDRFTENAPADPLVDHHTASAA